MPRSCFGSEEQASDVGRGRGIGLVEGDGAGPAEEVARSRTVTQAAAAARRAGRRRSVRRHRRSRPNAEPGRSLSYNAIVALGLGVPGAPVIHDEPWLRRPAGLEWLPAWPAFADSRPEAVIQESPVRAVRLSDTYDLKGFDRVHGLAYRPTSAAACMIGHGEHGPGRGADAHADVATMRHLHHVDRRGRGARGRGVCPGRRSRRWRRSSFRATRTAARPRG